MLPGIWSPAHPAADVLGVGLGAGGLLILFRDPSRSLEFESVQVHLEARPPSPRLGWMTALPSVKSQGG